MAFFDWKDEYSVNIAELDVEHRKLVGLISEFYTSFSEASVSDGIGNAIKGLIHYARTHFIHEEDLLRRCKYPELAAQEAAHNAFMKKVEDFRKRIAEGNPVPASEVVIFMRSWLNEHILKADKKYSATLNAAGLR